MRCTPDLFILAAEASGDLLGADLLEQFSLHNHNLLIDGIAGPQMRKFMKSPYLPAESFYVMGFFDVIKALPSLISLYRKVKNHLLKHPPKLLVLIDYPGFNLRLAKGLKKKGFSSPIIHYVCPTIWAWKKKRIHTMTRYLDHLMCLFPFEPPLFKETQLDAFYVGHPLCKQIEQPLPSSSPSFIVICPGSRPSVIERNLPLQIQSIKNANQSIHHLKLAISCSSEQTRLLIQKIIEKESIHAYLFLPSEAAEVFSRALLAVSTSGTINLELALYEIPTIITYQLNFLDGWIAKYIFRISLPFYCIANIVCQKKIFEEFYGSSLSSKKISDAIEGLCLNIQEAKEKSRELRAQLTSHPGVKPAEWILKKLDEDKDKILMNDT